MDGLLSANLAMLANSTIRLLWIKHIHGWWFDTDWLTDRG